MAVSDTQDSTPDTTAKPRRWAVVTNTKAGALLGAQDSHATLRNLFADRKLEAEFIASEDETLPERIARAQETGADCVVVAGGDGTIACAAALLAGTGTALGIIPGGTMNLLASDLRIEAGDMAHAVDHLAGGEIRAIDAAMAGDHIFLCASMLGTPARLSRHREAGRRHGNGLRAWAGFARAAWRALCQNATLRLTLRHDGGSIRVRSPSITITVNALDDGSGRLFGRSCLDGGMLAVYIVRASSPWRQARLLVRSLSGSGLNDPEIDVIHTKTLEIDTKAGALRVLVDGEARLLKPPLRYVIRPAALRVVAPAGTAA